MKTTISLTLLTLAGALIPGTSLELQRGGPAWRIVTCHFTHFTYEQLAWDTLAFLVLGIACARRNRGAFQATLLASVLIVPIAVLAFAPNVATYRGLSGIDSALFALLLIMESRRSWIVAMCAIGFAMKLIFEMTTGATLFVPSSGRFEVVPVAHLAGAAVGVTVILSRRSRGVVVRGNAAEDGRRTPLLSASRKGISIAPSPPPSLGFSHGVLRSTCVPFGDSVAQSL
jgi:rhomboid family GlyGly-CTERM serine protease